MKRTTVMLPEALKRKAEARAKRLGISFGQLVRDALESFAADPSASEKRDPLFTKAVFDGGPEGGASDHDRHLYE